MAQVDGSRKTGNNVPQVSSKPLSSPSVRELRHRWKPQKQRLLQETPDHPTTVRFHRACSWLQRVEELPAGADDDLALISQWVAFNALYGRWDTVSLQPAGDRESWHAFLDRIFQLDQKQELAEVLQTHKPLVMSLLEDPYLSRYFWQEPSEARANKSKRCMFDARTWYLQGHWGAILDHLMERIYLQRCQLMHGAATYGGRLNRKSLRNCVKMLALVLSAILTVVAEYGADEDWGEMCYPPLKPGLPSTIP